MGRITIWFEPVLGRTREIFVRRCQDALVDGRGESFLYLVATRPLWEHVITQIVDGERVMACAEPRVFLFDGLVRRWLRENGDRRRILDEGERGALLERILRTLNDARALAHLGEIAHLPGCGRSIARLLGEIQRADLSAEEFAEFVNGSASPPSRDRDLAVIYLTYARTLQQMDLLDPDGVVRVVLDELRRRPDLPPWLRATRLLMLDGFFDFTPIQKKLLRYLIERIPETWVILFFDPENPEVFREPLRDTLEFFASFGDVVRESCSETLPSDPRLRLLRRRLFALESASPEADAAHREELMAPEDARGGSGAEPPIVIFAAMGFAQEVEEIGRTIKRLIQDEGYRASEIAVIARDRAYLVALADHLPRVGVPVAFDRREPLASIPIIRAALRILEARVHQEATESYVALLMNDYLHPFTTGDRDAAESAMRAVGTELDIHAFRKRARDMRRLKEYQARTLTARTVDLEEVQHELARLHRGARALETVLEAIEGMRRALGEIPQRGRIPELVEGFRRALTAFGLRERLQHKVETEGLTPFDGVGVSSDGTHLARDLRALHALDECLDDLYRLGQRACAQSAGASGREDQPEEDTVHRAFGAPLDVRQFRDLLLRWLEQREFRVERGDPAGVRLLEATQARGLAFRVVFLPGLVEGGFPRSPDRDWIYPASERERLARAGLYLEDLSPRRFEAKEAHFFYVAIAQATERVYLSYPRADATGQEMIPSPFLDDVQQACGRPKPHAMRELLEEAEEDPALSVRLVDPTTYDVRAIACVADVERTLVASLSQTTTEDPLVLHLYTEACRAGWIAPHLLDRVRMERARERGEVGPFTGLLTDPALRRHLQHRFGPTHVYSPSQLNMYGRCPFQFFCQRLLRLERREEASLDLVALDRGYLLHAILREFFARRSGGSLLPERRHEYEQEVRRVAEDIFAEYEQKALPMNRALWELEKAEILDMLMQFLEAEIAYQHQTERRMRPHWLELGFGMGPSDADQCHPDSAREPLVLTPRAGAGGDRILIRGRMDRVDRSDDGCYIVYDYKLGEGSSVEEMRAGIDLQIPLYILALTRLFVKSGEDVIGGGYYSIRTGKRTRGLYRREFSALTAISDRVPASLTSSEWERILEDAQRFVWKYVAGMRRGDFRVQPASEACCPRCDYRTVCRYDRSGARPSLRSEEAQE